MLQFVSERKSADTKKEALENENFSEKLEEIGLNFFIDSKFKAYKEKFLVAL